MRKHAEESEGMTVLLLYGDNVEEVSYRDSPASRIIVAT